MSNRRTENSRTLASLIGGNEVEAASLLNITIDITVDPRDQQALLLADFLYLVLGRTVDTVRLNASAAQVNTGSLELVIGDAPPVTFNALRILVTAQETRIGRREQRQRLDAGPHSLLLLVAACYASSRAMTALFGNRLRVSALQIDESLVIRHVALIGESPAFLTAPLFLSETYLAGAGAVGNGIALALSLLDVSGGLDIVDSDIISDGNLNRCVLFTDGDIGLSKAKRLADVLKARCPKLVVTPHERTIQELSAAIGTSDWLKRLLVAIDSPRGRRRLQSEIPREVFDGSTTGVEEVVFHHHVQPTETACLACVYHETPTELARETHIAEALGISVAEVQEQFVSPETAQRIVAKYTDLKAADLVGQAFDTLFKALCGEGTLLAPEGRQVLAPFAFVSVLAGALVVIELAKRLTLGPQSFNHWRLSPWMAPVDSLKRVLPRHPACSFCSQPTMLRVAKRLWTT